MVDEDDAEFYRQHANELIRFATMLVGPSEAADVLADAFLGVLSSRSWRTVRDRRAYLYRAVLNAARSTRRRTQRRVDREARAVQLVGRASFVDPSETEQELPDAVAALSDRQRAVIYLAYWHDLTPRAIGECLGISEGAARRYLARARTSLRRELDGQDD